MASMGKAMMGTGEAEGEGRALKQLRWQLVIHLLMTTL